MYDLYRKVITTGTPSGCDATSVVHCSSCFPVNCSNFSQGKKKNKTKTKTHVLPRVWTDVPQREQDLHPPRVLTLALTFFVLYKKQFILQKMIPLSVPARVGAIIEVPYQTSLLLPPPPPPLQPPPPPPARMSVWSDIRTGSV